MQMKETKEKIKKERTGEDSNPEVWECAFHDFVR